MGDPDGIGAEIIRKSLSQYAPGYPVIVIGTRDWYGDHSVPVIHDVKEIARQEKGTFFYHIDPGQIQGDPSFEYVKTGIQWALDKNVHALVTAPISKEKWLSAGVPYHGHTELLAKTAGVDKHSMFFWSDDLKVALFTVHIPLQEIFPHIKKKKIVDFVRFVSSELFRMFSKEFVFFVGGLNPHAGESGFLGREELDEIIPAVQELKGEIDIRGPYPPDVVFIKAREMENAVVISWYHDQGLIPFKLLNIDRGVNLTLGLPYIRTSPDHGTAYDIAGKDIANPSSMLEAIRLAEYLIQPR